MTPECDGGLCNGVDVCAKHLDEITEIQVEFVHILFGSRGLQESTAA